MVGPSVRVAAPPVHLRVAGAADASFLWQLYLDARPELQLLPPHLVDLQVLAQRDQYLRDHPQAVDEIVELDGERVGRCWTAGEDGELHVLDVAVLADRRRQGVGRAVLGVVAGRAAERRAAVRLAVWSSNDGARRLYRGLGFTETGAAGGHVLMRLEPEGTT